MKAIKFLTLIFAVILFFAGCQKELSYESGFSGNRGKGSLLSLGGNCQPVKVGGYYVQDSTLNDSNYVVVNVNVSNPGSYYVYTENKNGFSFSDSGFFITTGPQTLTLKATGKPIAIQQTLFTVAFDTSICSFAVDVVDSIVLPSKYSFPKDSVGNCLLAVVSGTYKVGTSLNSTNKVDVKINVSSPGSYNVISDTVGGMWFKSSGIVYANGIQTIVFTGYGIPKTTAFGNNSFTISNGVNTCNFVIKVDSGTVVVVPPGNSDSAWSFNQTSANFFVGPIDTAFLVANPLGGSILTITGSTLATGDSTLNMVISLPGATIVPGTYKTNVGFLNVFDFSDATGTSIYSSNFGTTGAVMNLVITSYSATTKIVKGTFTGNAKDAAGTNVPITNGKFQAVVK